MESLMVDQPLQTTKLHAWHQANGGRMVDFAGWELPVFYATGTLAEHHATRTSVGLFDIDHMGQVTVTGPAAIEAVDRLVSSDMTSLAVGEAKYGLLCGPDGGVIDDVFVYRTQVDAMMIVVNAANRDVDVAWIGEQADGSASFVVDRSDELEMIAVQGPRAVELVDAVTMSTTTRVADLARFMSTTVELFGTTAIVGRTGYTGEDGVELYISGGVEDVWTGLLNQAARDNIEATAVGLSARDSLRFEPGYPLYGHELSREISPLEARLGWAVNLDGADFIGRDAIRRKAEEGITRRLETLVLDDKGVPREGCHVLDLDGNDIGTVVSGMFAPTANVFAANAFLPLDHVAVGTQLALDVRGKAKACHVAKRPLYRRPNS
jgi:glycine cleavage system T protein